MCFSAEASFAGAAVVGGIGVATLTQLDRKRDLLYGTLPFAFAVHQFLEGVTWVRLNNDPSAELTDWAVHLWVIYAWALLPLWLPLSVWLMEPDARRRRWLAPFVVLGGATLAFLLVGALRPEILVRVVDGELDYVLPFPHPVVIAIPYILCTCVAQLLSSFRWVKVFGVANLVALGLAAALQAMDFSSIWCTFAAFLSVIVFLHFREQHRLRAVATAPTPSPA